MKAGRSLLDCAIRSLCWSVFVAVKTKPHVTVRLLIICVGLTFKTDNQTAIERRRRLRTVKPRPPRPNRANVDGSGTDGGVDGGIENVAESEMAPVAAGSWVKLIVKDAEPESGLV